MLHLDDGVTLEVSPDYSSLDLVIDAPCIYISATLKPEQVAALIVLLKAALPKIEKGAIADRRVALANKASGSEREALFKAIENDDEFIGEC